MDHSRLVFVDVEARGTSPINGTMTEFGAVHFKSLRTFHGVLFESYPDPEIPAIPVVGERRHSDVAVAHDFAEWLRQTVKGQPVFVSDNPAFDWMWIAGMFDIAGMKNPFGHSGRRIGDFWAGINLDWSNTQKWKKFRQTKHDHNPVNDAMGNVEALREIIRRAEEMKNESR